MSGIKHDANKVPFELLSVPALIEIAKVMDFGKQKYSAHNWREGFNWSRLYGAAMRHLLAHMDGEDKDPETGLSHLAHLGCCVMFLLEHEKCGLGWDDRYKRPAKEFKNPPLQDDTLFDNCKVKFANEPTRMYTKADVSIPTKQFGMAVGEYDAYTVQLGMHTKHSS